MTEYHNPYHFVPVKPDARPDDLPRQDFPLASKQVTHDRYYPDAYSGRIICRLTTESPIFVGAQQTRKPSKKAPREVAPFELDKKPAIPGSSLRGLISSIAEAASNSALRVLEEKPYSYRQTMTESLSAIGMIFMDRDEEDNPKIDKNGNPQCLLRPLTLPMMEVRPKQPISLPSGFDRSLYPEPNLKVYIGDAKSIRSSIYYETFILAAPKYYGLKLHSRAWNGGGLLINNYLHIRNGKYLLAQKPIIKEEPRAWDELSEEEKTEYTRGILRVLGCKGRSDIPNTKKHEIFIPYPEVAEKWPMVSVPPDVVERFYNLADQRTEAGDEDVESPWPYHPNGTDRNLNSNGNLFRLKDGDLVYFRAGGLGEIIEISLSSIWRGRVETSARQRATAHTFFERIGKQGKELLPFNASRETITIAEQVFGFVEQSKTGDQGSSLALAGRVYFSDARIRGIKKGNSNEWIADDCGLKDPYLPSVTLKILDSPKPPSPAMYFKASSGKPGYITKRDLTPGKHQPQGRKIYLHHRAQEISEQAWSSSYQYNEPQADLDECRFKQKVQVTPLKSGAVFYFHVDFDNLSGRELGLLIYSLKPAPNFRHKIGMGKPIGLGKINIEPVGIFRINRQERYTSNGLFGPRYSEVWKAQFETMSEWPEEYETEKTTGGAPIDIERVQKFFSDNMDNDIKHVLELLGNPGAIKARVHTPLVSGGEEDAEKDTYRWFVANDFGSGSKEKGNRIEAAKVCLEPLNENSKKLPILRALDWSE